MAPPWKQMLLAGVLVCLKRILKGEPVKIDNLEIMLPKSMDAMGHYLEIVQAFANQLKAMLSHHSRVLVFRIDVRLITPSNDNKPISKLVRAFKRSMRTKKHTRIAHIWCREQSSSEVQHYHCYFMVDEHKTRNPKRLIDMLTVIASRQGLAKPFTPENCYMVIRRGDVDAFVQAVQRASYIGKVATKQARPAGVNDYSASRINNRQTQTKPNQKMTYIFIKHEVQLDFRTHESNMHKE